MKVINEMEMKFKAISQNESFARACVSGFCLNTGLTVEELTDIKTAVSEAVTNSVVHAYPNGKSGNVYMKVTIFENYVSIEIKDEGVGIDNIDKAREPFYTTKPNDDRSGMGFTVMESFMDELIVSKNDNGRGIVVKMKKNINNTDLAVGENI